MTLAALLAALCLCAGILAETGLTFRVAGALSPVKGTVCC